MPRRRRPGASCDTVAACWAMITGCLGHVGMIAVPTRIVLVAVTAAAKAVSGSAFVAPPMVVQATGTPQDSARWICATNSRAFAAGDLSILFGDGARDALGLYAWSEADREALYALYAPRFLIDEATGDDKIGALQLDADGKPWVNIFRPTVYRRITHTYFGGRWLAQFVYAVWFPARGARAAVDLLAGQFDGLIWRVTVGTDGAPLVYDSIHPCGCYHLFFPTAAVRAKPRPAREADADLELRELCAAHLDDRYPPASP